jgi:hypothetical protein
MLSGRCGRKVRQRNSVDGFPVISWHHFDGVPRATIKEGAIRSLAGALLATDAEIWINFDSPEWRVILVWYPEHTRFDWAIFNAGRRAGAAGATVGSDCKDSRPFLARRFAVALRHRPMFFYDVIHISCLSWPFCKVGGPDFESPASKRIENQ